MFKKLNWQEALYEDLTRLSPLEIMGAVQCAGVKQELWINLKAEDNSGEQILLALFNRVEEMNRVERRNFLKTIHYAATHRSEVSDGPTTEDN